ncbi:MAG TPA: carboxyl transferase domain-containing protein [Caulobacteraceae bacterium]|nr:carboxyl transferase domain-containing protein [Caulobacteraceae bacterium]
MKKLLIANRGEIAIRIARTAADMGIASVAVCAEDDAASLHARLADEAAPLKGVGAAAYLDIGQVVAIAEAKGCDAVHPGYGFLSENAAFARACADSGLTFVGPAPETLALFGDKTAALELAAELDIPVLPGTRTATTLGEALDFLASLGPDGAVMLKALAGGGGRGMRPATDAGALAEAYERCASEARAAFGDGSLYVERFFPKARHVEVQIAGDGTGAAVHVWDRECSLQRQRQKIVEVAPAADVAPAIREQLWASAVRMASAAKYKGLGTIEFLVNAEAGEPRFAFIEANPRLQVEHTVTEEVTGVDLVRLQLRIAGGEALAEIGYPDQDAVPPPRGVALQARVNLETMAADGGARPSGGEIAVYEPPSGPGVRVDGFGYGGYRTSARYDSLLAKLIVHGQDLPGAAAKAARALAEFRLVGVASNIPFLRALTRRLAAGERDVHTRWVETHMPELLAETAALQPASGGASEALRRAGAKIDAVDPLAVLAHGKSAGETVAPTLLAAPEPAAFVDIVGPEGATPLRAPLQGTVVSLAVEPGDAVRAGQTVAIMESMKMEHVIAAGVSGYVVEFTVTAGDTVFEGHPLAFIEEADVGAGGAAEAEDVDLDHIRTDLALILDRHARTLDAARPEAVARRRKTGQRTTRENIDDLLDPGSFVEYGALTVAARRRRNTLEELIAQTPADGLVMGLGRINGALFGEEAARAAVMAYDYTVLAGTQGAYNHHKMDRVIELAERWKLPTVFFCEGGGGRPGDTDGGGGGGTRGFEFWGKMSAVAPMIGITSGRCFAGNASVLGCCDVIIATEGSNIGMGGPAMIEGGGLGVFRPEDIGPVSVQAPNGVIDILVEDEAAAVAAAKQYVSYFQGTLKAWSCPDQRRLRRVIPENRLRVYDIRELIGILADEGSVLEIRPSFGQTMVAALVRIEGRPMGLIANNPKVLGGAIDGDGSDKAARFLQICEAFDLPVLSLSDTPGMMVGPEIEKTALVRHCSRLFIIGANLTVPILSVFLRKSYGLGALAMTGGSYQASAFAVAWPTGEFGGMGLEGSVKLGYRNELAAIEDPVARRAKFDEMVAQAYASGKAINRATSFFIDDVIDPADTRRWIMGALKSLPPPPVRAGKKLPWIDAW